MVTKGTHRASQQRAAKGRVCEELDVKRQAMLDVGDETWCAACDEHVQKLARQARGPSLRVGHTHVVSMRNASSYIKGIQGQSLQMLSPAPERRAVLARRHLINIRLQPERFDSNRRRNPVQSAEIPADLTSNGVVTRTSCGPVFASPAPLELLSWSEVRR